MLVYIVTYHWEDEDGQCHDGIDAVFATEASAKAFVASAKQREAEDSEKYPNSFEIETVLVRP